MDGSPTKTVSWPSRLRVWRSVDNPSLHKKNPITEFKVKENTTDQRRRSGRKYVKGTSQRHGACALCTNQADQQRPSAKEMNSGDPKVR